MYPPPPAEVIARLVGQTISHVTFFPYTISLVLENGDFIQVEGPFWSSKDSEPAIETIHDFPIAESDLVRLPGTIILSAECESDGTLHLRFSDKSQLVVYANNPMYEAYLLQIDKKQYVV